jgi:hypothetical protein
VEEGQQTSHDEPAISRPTHCHFAGDAICTKEMTLTWMLAAGLDTSAEQVAICELYRTLRVACHCQAHRMQRPSTWLARFPTFRVQPGGVVAKFNRSA